jgi:hypothetical protein
MVCQIGIRRSPYQIFLFYSDGAGPGQGPQDGPSKPPGWPRVAETQTEKSKTDLPFKNRNLITQMGGIMTVYLCS